MAELPDIEAYRHALASRLIGSRLAAIRIDHPFFLRSVEPAPESCIGATVTAVQRLGKRLAFVFGEGPALVLHLMIAGRLRYTPGATQLPRRAGGARRGSAALCHLLFEPGLLSVTEAGSKRRAALHVVPSPTELAQFRRGGIEVLDSDAGVFSEILQRERHTLKRALTDPRLFSGIGNAYSDEILFAARLSPFKLTTALTGEEIARLYEAATNVLDWWRELLVGEADNSFPTKVTAFRPEMKVHGKYGEPCVRCGTPVQRIRYADNEANYCPTCQTDGRLLADRALSRLLKSDWPRTVEELERAPGFPGVPG